MFSGNITTVRSLDRETTAMLEVAVVVTDLAGHSDVCFVRVSVQDVNDNPPKFCFPEYYTSIPANFSVDSVFLKVSTT